MAKNVATPIAAVEEMAHRWPLIDALRGGTAGMREAGEVFLPRRNLEERADYKKRLGKATLFNAFNETTHTLTGRVFAAPVMLGGDVPQWMTDEVLDDVDMQGHNFHTFVREWFHAAMEYGLSHVLVESQTKQAPDGTVVVTLADQKKARMRPYGIHLPPKRIIGWRQVDGVLTQLRAWFCREADDGEFGVVEIPQVYVYEPGRVRVYEKAEKQDTAGEEKWDLVEERLTEMDTITLVTLYTRRTGFMTGASPMQDLADLNQKHWSMQSDNDELVHTASVPILVLIGGPKDDQEIVIGSKSAIKLPRDAELKYVEHTGAAIDAGRAALTALKEEMRDAGAKLLMKTTGSKTAAQANEEADRENSALGSIVKDFDDTMCALLDAFALYRGETDGGTAEAKANLNPDNAPVDTMKVVLDMNSSGKVSDETTFYEAQRRGILGEDLDWEEEQVRITENPIPTPPPTPIDPITGLPIVKPQPIPPAPIPPGGA